MGSERSPLLAQLYQPSAQEKELGLVALRCEQPGNRGRKQSCMCHGGRGVGPRLPGGGGAAAAATEAAKDRAN